MLFTFYVAHVPGIVLLGLTKMKHGEGEGAESIAFHTRDIEITYQVWKYGVASVLLVYQRSSSKEGHTAIRPESELIRDFILLTPPRTWRRRTGRQLKTWATTFKEDLESLSRQRIFGCSRWRKNWLKVPCQLGQARRALGAGSTRPGRMPL